jgi:hypothetical protein
LPLVSAAGLWERAELVAAFTGVALWPRPAADGRQATGWGEPSQRRPRPSKATAGANLK